MPLYIFARFEPRQGKERQLLDELMRVLAPTRGSPTYFIHSEWIDEEAFDAHAELPHTTRFLAAVDGLLTHPLQVVRTKQIG